jgi:uncharacterized protein (DUF1330 family)
MITLFKGVNVVDPETYAAYRARMTPILEAYGGRFEVDVRVAEVLRSPGQERYNRLFSLSFPSIERLEAFFADPAYVAVRRELLDASVSEIVSLGRYEVMA